MLTNNAINTLKKVTIAHSVDADDAFMFYALAKNIIKNEKFEFLHILKDIQTLNKESFSSIYDVQAISFFAYPEIERNYQLLSCGGSLGKGYGPTVIGNNKEKVSWQDLKDQTIAVPGEKTTAYLLLKLLVKEFKPVFVPFDKIIEGVTAKKYPFGLIIHEGQLSYLQYGLNKIIDLGEWWFQETSLPVPLGGNVIKRNFTREDKTEINDLIRQSILFALENKDKVIPAVTKYARDIKNDESLVDKFVSMYVNNYTVDYGVNGRNAIEKLYSMAYYEGFIPKIPKLDFVE